MWRNITSTFFSLMVAILVVFGGLVAMGQNMYKKQGPLASAMCLRVPAGSNMRKVSDNLQQSGAIKSSMIFRVGANYERKSKSLKAGSFLVPAGAPMAQIVDIVTRGGRSTCGTEVVFRIGIRRSKMQVRVLDPNTSRYVEQLTFDPIADELPKAYVKTRLDGDLRYRVLLAEGLTSWQIVEALKSADFLEGEVAQIPPEGMLAPDSYEVKAGSSREDVLGRMLAAQVKILDDAWAARADGLPLANKEEAMVLASIVEKETGIASERRQVASVFINRLNKGIRLQTDPTVIYGITKGKSILGRGLRRSELRAKTDYNTYQIDGLPPGPIANPGRAAIEAALNPDATDYIFFVADGTGGHAFAKTLQEHNNNVAKWRKIEAERNNN